MTRCVAHSIVLAFMMDGGRSPVSWLPYVSQCSILRRPPNESGIEPLNLFSCGRAGNTRCRVWPECCWVPRLHVNMSKSPCCVYAACERYDGGAPRACSSIRWRMSIPEIWSGIVPEIWLSESPNVWSSRKLPTSVGIVPMCAWRSHTPGSAHS